MKKSIKQHMDLYTKEFKLEAIRLAESSANTTAKIATELGIRRNQIYKWKDQLTAKTKNQAG